jgi:hypothetical protein
MENPSFNHSSPGKHQLSTGFHTIHIDLLGQRWGMVGQLLSFGQLLLFIYELLRMALGEWLL